MQPVDGYVETEDVRLHYVDWGGDGPPLVLVHATGFHARLWDPYAERLHDRLRVLALDQRGHGDSGQPRTGMVWPSFAEDLAAVIAALGIEGCYAAGHSSGGTAVGMCAGNHPSTIRRMMLIDAVLRDPRRAGVPPGEPNVMAERTRRRRSVWESPRQFEQAMRERRAFARWRPEILSLYAHHGLRRRTDGHYQLKCPPEVEAAVYEGAMQNDPWPALGRVRVPVMLLRATLAEDGRTPMPPDTATRIPNCTDLPVAATHFIPMEEPETVLAAMEGFFHEE